jgi:hypothetical protein
MASSLIRPWHLGQARTSTAKVRAKSSAHGRYPPASPVRSGSALAGAGSSVGALGAMPGLHGLAAASTLLRSGQLLDPGAGA